MRRPQLRDEQPHQRRRGQREGGVIEEADRQEAEDERARRTPEPEVLMQDVEESDKERGNRWTHDAGRYYGVAVGLKSTRPSWRDGPRPSGALIGANARETDAPLGFQI